jgi:hypothetical protein
VIATCRVVHCVRAMEVTQILFKNSYMPPAGKCAAVVASHPDINATGEPIGDALTYPNSPNTCIKLVDRLILWGVCWPERGKIFMHYFLSDPSYSEVQRMAQPVLPNTRHGLAGSQY